MLWRAYQKVDHGWCGPDQALLWILGNLQKSWDDFRDIREGPLGLAREEDEAELPWSDSDHRLCDANEEAACQQRWRNLLYSRWMDQKRNSARFHDNEGSPTNISEAPDPEANVLGAKLFWHKSCRTDWRRQVVSSKDSKTPYEASWYTWQRLV